MGALRKTAGRTVIPAVPAVAGTEATQICTTTPSQPQYRPPLADDGDSGGPSGCYDVPNVICREAGAGDSAAERTICEPVGTVEVCT